MIGVDVWNGSTTQMQNYVHGAGRNITYPIGIKGGTVGSQWGLDRSSYVIIDRAGMITYITPQSTNYTQRLTKHKTELVAKLDELIAETAVEPHELPIPNGFRLQQNYPNPFQTSTVLRFDLGLNANQQFTRLVIYDVLGREVKSIVGGQLFSGSYESVWDARDNKNNRVAPGIYFLLLKSGKHQLVRKMIYTP
ncbi:T9SS type A sorting domain-containing protein [candidate division KSB1 bacterium]|nr:T9SS type A sorting domain-containing protein [candidate division KSB1 bacterium]